MAASSRARRSAGPDEVGVDGAEAPLLCRTELNMLLKRDSAAPLQPCDLEERPHILAPQGFAVLGHPFRRL